VPKGSGEHIFFGLAFLAVCDVLEHSLLRYLCHLYEKWGRTLRVRFEIGSRSLLGFSEFKE